MSDIAFGELLSEPLRNGVSYPSRTRGEGVRMVNMREIFAYDRITSEVECERVPLTPSEMISSVLQPGDLLFARQSLTYEGAGKVSLVMDGSGPTWDSHLIRARVNPARGNSAYLYYFFRSAEGRRRMETIVHQVAAAGIRGSELARLAVPSPPLAEQHAIAEVLGALDDKIAANTALAANAERLLRAEVDVAWLRREDRSSTLAEFVDFNPKVSVPRSESAVYVDMKRLPESGWSIDGYDRREPRGGARFRNGDTLLARITPCLENRKTGFVNHLRDDDVGIGSTEFIVMRTRHGIAAPISFLLATEARFREFAIQHMIGTSGRQRVAASDLAAFELPTPDFAWLDQFGRRVDALFAAVAAQARESRTLAETRDALLPQLMSGKLRVRDAEQAVAAAGA